MPKPKSPLMAARPGDIVAVDVGDGVFCYLRIYQFGQGVLPFLSRGLVKQVSAFPSLAPRFFIQTWVYDSDPTPIFVVGHVPFASERESWGQPMYYPPDPIEPCFKIHGVFNGAFSIIKPVSKAEVAGLEVYERYQPAELRNLLFTRYKDWGFLGDT
jgi:hypothetical protein